MTVYDLRIGLDGVHPPVWRRIRIPADTSIDSLHFLILMAMGWEAHEQYTFFSEEGRQYGPEEDGGEGEVLNARSHLLAELFFAPGGRCRYRLGSPDGWMHLLELEQVQEKEEETPYITCLAGSGACPPLGCGGPAEYHLLVQAFGDPAHGRHEEAVRVLGEDFDPESFACALLFDQEAEACLMGKDDTMALEKDELIIFTKLTAFLGKEGMPGSVMPSLAVDGLFTVLSIIPHSFSPHQWLPLVWDITGQGATPVFASPGEEEEGRALLQGYCKAVQSRLERGPDAFMPLSVMLDMLSRKDAFTAVQDWAMGFGIGLELDEALREKTFSDERGRVLLVPLAILAGAYDEHPDFGADEVTNRKYDVIASLGQIVFDLRQYWAGRDSRHRFPPFKAPGASRTGTRRNDPCPCGSGKKYKHCCGK